MSNSIAIVGDGRVGNALAGALRLAGAQVSGPHRHGFAGDGSDVVLLCVPDRAIAEAAAPIPVGPLLGHCSGACPLAALGERPAFSIHPLMTFVGDEVDLDGTWCAVTGTGPDEQALATGLAELVGMRPFDLREQDRSAYHAAASIASNFLIVLEADAQELAGRVGVPPEALAPLVAASVENLRCLGPQRALTGPIARGDQETVDRQREAIECTAPELLELFDAMAARTRELAMRSRGALA